MLIQLPFNSNIPFVYVYSSQTRSNVLGNILRGIVQFRGQSWPLLRREKFLLSSYCSSNNVQTPCKVQEGSTSINEEIFPLNTFMENKLFPNSDPLTPKDADLLHDFFYPSTELGVFPRAKRSKKCRITNCRSASVTQKCIHRSSHSNTSLPFRLSKRALNLSVISLFFYGFSSNVCEVVFAEELELERYTDSKEGFTLLKPSSWIKVDKAGATVLFEEVNKGSNNVGVVVNPVRLTRLGDFGTPQFVAEKLIQAEKRKESTKDARVIDVAERSGQGGLQVYEFEYAVDSTRGGVKRIFSAAFVASKKLYILNISHSDKPETPLDSHRRIMLEQVLHSFDATASLSLDQNIP